MEFILGTNVAFLVGFLWNSLEVSTMIPMMNSGGIPFWYP